MRPLYLCIPVALTLVSGDGRHQIPDGAFDRTLLTAQATDTGELARRDPRGLPACPMPVDRPDPASFLPMPTSRRPSPLNGVIIVDSGPPPAQEMPVARSGCRNPLDQPTGQRDSVRVDGQPRH